MFANRHISLIPKKSGVRTVYNVTRIGRRDVVGHGCNGSYVYKDDAHFPFPAIRFMDNTRHIMALRQKEKGDWRMLCCEDKKALYRASFCQTFAEFQHPTGQWKFIVGWGLFFISFGFWIAIFYKSFVCEPLPEHLNKENQKAQLRRMLEIRANPIDGISSLWNYDEDNWKVKLIS
ncbi:cytochrome c oxidase subunit 4 isoform 1, mitochondrial-like [Pectinophora gossypiella]|uniref:cytochrome c oxidase subunit 4 isoform 1, mitochondrial-like n=1 Tax=Pectinophora gossypiella TaxID=13191 RepID=UPI00214E9ABC|nr:cytochrome c oxidase subunit 4 isoform 1, mitochondrial-like [Pectinophora gossypiella]